MGMEYFADRIPVIIDRLIYLRPIMISVSCPKHQKMESNQEIKLIPYQMFISSAPFTAEPNTE